MSFKKGKSPKIATCTRILIRVLMPIYRLPSGQNKGMLDSINGFRFTFSRSIENTILFVMRSKMNRRFSSYQRATVQMCYYYKIKTVFPSPHTKAFQKKSHREVFLMFPSLVVCERRRCHHSDDTLLIQLYTFQCFLCVYTRLSIPISRYLSFSFTSSLFYGIFFPHRIDCINAPPKSIPFCAQIHR